jgi:hypothetical protein
MLLHQEQINILIQQKQNSTNNSSRNKTLKPG